MNYLVQIGLFADLADREPTDVRSRGFASFAEIVPTLRAMLGDDLKVHDLRAGTTGIVATAILDDGAIMRAHVTACN